MTAVQQENLPQIIVWVESFREMFCHVITGHKSLLCRMLIRNIKIFYL